MLSQQVWESTREPGGGPQSQRLFQRILEDTLSIDPTCSPVPVLYIQLHPGANILLGVPAGELRVEDVDHDGSAGGLQHHLPAHARPRPG